MEGFDPLNIEDISQFINFLNETNEDDHSDNFLLLNIKKVVDGIKNLNESEYYDERVKKLILLLMSLTFEIKCRHVNVREEILNYEFHSILKKILEFYKESDGVVSKYEEENMAFIFASLNNITFESTNIAKENINSGLVKVAFDCLQNGDFLIEPDKDDLKSTQSLYLYDNIVRFLLSNAEEPAISKELSELNLTEVILKEKSKLDKVLKQDPKRKNELKLIEVRLVCILASLMDDDELEKFVQVSQTIVEKLIGMLNETIKRSKSNNVILGTKFYLTYEINKVPTYVYARSLMKRFNDIAVNDKIKQIIFDSNGLPLIIQLLYEGNTRERFISCELICSLCFNENVKNYLKNDEKTMNLIRELMKISEHAETKKLCNQIIEMVNKTLEKRLTSTQTVNSNTQKGHIMISYNWKHQKKCLELNNELKRMGYTTWIDVEKMPGNIFDGMADAVENSPVVLICYSDSYRKSTNCRLEAEYAFKLKKNLIFIRMESEYSPQGWIGLLIGQKLYVDYSKHDVSYVASEVANQIQPTLSSSDNLKDASLIEGKKISEIIKTTHVAPEHEHSKTKRDKHNFETRIEPLHLLSFLIIVCFLSLILSVVSKSIYNAFNFGTTDCGYLLNHFTNNFNKILQDNNDIRSSINQIQTASNCKGADFLAKKEKFEQVLTWKFEDIENWLKTNDLNEFIPVFKDYDGIAFVQLIKIKQEIPKLFYSLIDEEILKYNNNIKNRQKLLFYFHFNSLFLLD